MTNHPWAFSIEGVRKALGFNTLVVVNDFLAIAESIEVPKGAEIVDGQGKTLLPGLIDSHVHLASVPGFSPVMEYRHPFLTREYRAQLPRSFLRYGYTTVIDLLPTNRDVLAAFVAAPVHPDLFHCGALPLRAAAAPRIATSSPGRPRPSAPPRSTRPPALPSATACTF